MARINPKLLAAIVAKTGLSRRQVYSRIEQVARTEYLPRHLAAIKVGANEGVPINRFASSDELAELRRTGGPVTPPPPSAMVTGGNGIAKSAPRSKTAKRNSKTMPNQVFVVHGRDRVAKDAIFAFLRSVGVKPIEWNSAIKMSKKPSPYVGEILDAAFAKARAVVVLLTPDDLAQLREDLLSPNDPAYERRLTGQARPNVLFEAGMAFSSHPDRTVLVQVGNLRPFSDTAGRHVVHMSPDPAKRQELATKLENAGCDVDTSGTDWLTAGDFTDPEARIPIRPDRKKRSPTK
jgi:predicted nucleotide-binding protein